MFDINIIDYVFDLWEPGRDGNLLIVYRNLYSVDYLFGILIFDFILGYFSFSRIL